MRCTDRKLTPTAFANRRPVQCSLLAAAGARSITRCTVTAGNGGCLVAGQVPSAMNRACQRHTHHRLGLAGSPRDLGRAAAIARMILARQTCFRGALRSSTIASS
jgi:hypothetical protein